MTLLAYEFPAPAERAAWEQKISAGIAAGTLVWTHVAGQQWRLDGTCPRCEHQFGNYLDFQVVVSRGLRDPAVAGLSTQIVCLCDVDPPHRKDTLGCGAGKGLEISLAPPALPEAGG